MNPVIVVGSVSGLALAALFKRFEAEADGFWPGGVIGEWNNSADAFRHSYVSARLVKLNVV
jgi:hypothetical protein